MLEVLRQAIRDVDCTARDAAGGEASGDPWRGSKLRSRGGISPPCAQRRKSERREPDGPRHRDHVAGPEASAPERCPVRHLSQRGDRQRERRPSTQVAPCKGTAKFTRERQHPAGQAVEEVGLNVPRQLQGDEEPPRHRAHRRQVREVHRQRLVPHVFGGKAPVEVHALADFVGRDAQLPPRRGPQDRTVVARAEDQPLPALGEVAHEALDEGELAGHDWLAESLVQVHLPDLLLSVNPDRTRALRGTRAALAVTLDHDRLWHGFRGC